MSETWDKRVLEKLGDHPQLSEIRRLRPGSGHTFDCYFDQGAEAVYLLTGHRGSDSNRNLMLDHAVAARELGDKVALSLRMGTRPKSDIEASTRIWSKEGL